MVAFCQLVLDQLCLGSARKFRKLGQCVGFELTHFTGFDVLMELSQGSWADCDAFGCGKGEDP